MIKLYSTLAPVYHEMYQQIFDYEKEFRFYHAILKKRKCSKIIEIGCGTGLLAKRLINAGYDYTGVDLYDEMLDIASIEAPSGKFIRGDMRHLAVDGHFDCALITGRSLGYIISNPELISTFNGINHILKNKGFLVFDLFDANKIFEHFVEESEQVVKSGSKTITRKNFLKMNLETGWTWDFNAKYIIEENNEKVEYDDFSTLRAFTKEEIRLLLKLTGFNLLEIIQDNVLTAVSKKVH
jgi:SAM-dependent methyltransferase